jgi:hypothetical protein
MVEEDSGRQTLGISTYTFSKKKTHWKKHYKKGGKGRKD